MYDKVDIDNININVSLANNHFKDSRKKKKNTKLV